LVAQTNVKGAREVANADFSARTATFQDAGAWYQKMAVKVKESANPTRLEEP